MATAAKPAARRDQSNEPPIDGELMESTERALQSLTGGEAATMDTSMVAILTRAELDQMVVTARAYPRSVQRALDSIKEIACLDIQTASSCGYALPRGRDEQTGKQNVIAGPSVRLAEISACQWGNCQAASRVTEVNREEGWVEAEGVFIDFQTNYRVTARVRRSIRGKPYGGKPGKVFGDDMINVTSNAAAAIAFRNAVFKGVPKPIVDRAYEATKAIVRGDEKSLGSRRVDLLVAYRDNLKIAPEQVYAILGVKGEQDIGLDELVVAAGFYSALKNNELTVEDLMKQITPTGQAGGDKTLGGAFTAPAGGDNAGGAQGSGSAASGVPATGKAAATTVVDGDGKPTGEKADPKTGEVEEPTVVEGKAPAGVAHFLAEATALDQQGRRAVFKDGVRFSARKPDAPDTPIYTELADEVPETEDETPAADTSPALATAEEQTERTGQVEAAAEARSLAAADAAHEDAEPEEFVTFRETISGADTWLAVQASLKTLRNTPAYLEASEEVQKGLRLEARAIVEALRETGKDPVDPKRSAAYYLLWLDGAAATEVQAVWMALIRTEEYPKFSDVQKDALAEATEKAKGTL